MEALQFTLKNDLNQLVVRVGVLEIQIICEDLSIGNLALEQLNHDRHFLALNFEPLRVVRRFTDGLVQAG